jgi:hypothetical protein
MKWVVKTTQKSASAVPRWLSYVALSLTAITLAVPNWVETSLGIDPDRGSGVVEYLIAFGFSVVCAVSYVSARYLRVYEQGTTPHER